MKSKTIPGSTIGLIIGEGIWVIDAAVDLYTGKMTYTEFFILITLSLFLALAFHNFVIRKKKKNKAK